MTEEMATISQTDFEGIRACIENLHKAPLTDEEKNRVKYSYSVSWRPRLMHHLLKIRDSRFSEEEKLNSFAWILNNFDEREIEIVRLRKYKHHARRAFRSLQNAYEKKLGLLADIQKTLYSPVEVVKQVLSQIGLVTNDEVTTLIGESLPSLNGRVQGDSHGQ